MLPRKFELLKKKVVETLGGLMEIVKMYQAGYEIQYIAKVKGESREDVLNHLRNKFSIRTGVKLSDNYAKVIIKRAAYRSIKEVAEELDIDRKTISRFKSLYADSILDECDDEFYFIEHEDKDICPLCGSKQKLRSLSVVSVYSSKKEGGEDYYCHNCCTQYNYSDGIAKVVNWDCVTNWS